MAKLMWMTLSFTFGFNASASMINFFVLGLEVFQKSKGISVSRCGCILLGCVAMQKRGCVPKIKF
jgi:hypothetical protein